MKLISSLLLVLFLCAHAWADEPILIKGQKVKVMPLGDSITLGKDQCMGGYRRPLYEWLIATGYPIVYVGKQNINLHSDLPNTINNASDGSIQWHEGYGSFRTDMTLNGGEAESQTAPPLKVTLQNYKPDVVLLMIGTNDFLQSYQLDTIMDRLQKIIDTIVESNPKTTVVVASIPGVEINPETAKKVIEYGQNIRAMVDKQKALGRKVAFADIYAAIGPGGRVHPDDHGYAKMAAAWYKALTGKDAPPIDESNPLLIPKAPAPSPTPAPSPK